MGEIATWSAVKTKVGLGKDSNECPTKAELLALSPTGTGENYVGLEISNASSYGNNETVQLSDIHRVTYKYTFSQAISTLSFTALGGQSTNGGSIFNVISTKRKYLDGIATGSDIEVAYSSEDLPDWIIFQDNVFKALENTALSSRNYTRLSTQSESGKTLSGSFTQAAATQSWEYTLSHGVWNETDDLYTAIAGEYRTYLMDERSYKQEKRNGKNYGPQIPVPVTVSSDSTWLTLNPTTFDDIKAETLIQTFQENKTLSRRYATITFTQAESGKKFTAKRYQAAGVKTYGNITITPTGDVPDIPASGGASHTFPYTWTQPWGWNGKTNDGGTLTTGGTETWNASVSGSNLGTTAKARTKLGVRTVTVTCNGKSGSASIDVYQAENRITNVTQGAWVVSISANPSTFTEQGGTSQISASARASRTNHWSSGATSAASDATGTPTLSIPTASTGFSLSGTTLTVAENTTANQRSVVVRATMDTVYKEVTVTQSAYLVEWRYTFTASPTTLNFDALGTAKSITITSYREKYINGSLVEGSRENVSYIHATSTEHIGTVLGTSISMQENQTTSTRDGKVSYEQNGSNKVIQITCNQAAGTITQQWVLREVSGFNTIPAVGGQVVASVESGYYDVINGTPKTWHNEAPEVDTNPGWISLTSVEYANNGYYTVKATGISNGSESSRSGKLTLTNSQKSLQLDIVQSGASIGYNYYFEVTSDFPSVAAAGATPKAVIKSRRYRVVNGVEESSYTRVDVSLFSKPNWTGVLSSKVSSTTGPGADYDVTLPVYENTSESVRRGAVVLQQSGSNKQITLNINQVAASITYQYTFEITDPSSKVINVPAKPIDPEPFAVSSFKTKVVNGTVTSETTRVGVTVDAIDENWLEVSVGSMGEGEVTCLENRTSSIRSVTITLRQEESGNLDQIDINQAAASVSTSYDIYYRRRVNTGSPTSPNIVITDRVTEVELEGTVGSPSFGFVSMELIIEKIQTINGNPQTPVRISSEFVKTNNSVNSVPSGQLTSALASTSEGDINDAIINIYNTVQNLAEYPRTHTVSFYRKDITLDGTVIGQIPDITVTVNPIPYTRVFEFGWKQEGSTITNITLEGDIYGSTGSRDIISYASLLRNNVEFAKKYIKPTFIPPSEDWLQVIDNGQNSDNSYNWAFRALTNNEGDSARNLQVRFEQPGNGNQALYAYVSQDPVATELNCELGNYYSYGASDIVNIGFGWSSRDGGDTTGSGGMNTPGGYLGARISLPAENDSIDMYAVGKPTYSKPLKIKLSNIRKVKKISYGNNKYTGLSVGYSQQDYKLGIVMSVGMESYFQLTPSILSESGEYGGGIQIQVTLKQTYNGYSGDSIADITLTPKDSNLPTLYLNIAWGNP